MKKEIRFLFFLINIFLLVPTILFAQNNKVTTFHYHSEQSDDDPRFKYDYKVFKLALEKTKNKYGAYEFKPLDRKINYKRIEYVSKGNKYKNLFFKSSVHQKLLDEFGYVSFPVDRGVVGYRVSFLSKKTKEKIKNVQTIEDLKKFTILQGLGWLDVNILKFNGFKVIEGSSYQGLFSMVANNRGDLFPRGINELLPEWNINKSISNLEYDDSVALYYPLPRFFFTNKMNKKAIERLNEGLSIAYEDGSLIKLWEDNYKDSISFVKLESRKVFKLVNPLLKGINQDYEKYIYTP